MTPETRQIPHVVFRADSSVRLGSGHLIRCLTLANELRRRGARCEFVSREHPGHLIARVEADGFAVRRLATGAANAATDAAATVALLGAQRPDWIVVDHYELGIEWERALRERCGALMAIEDLAGRAHDCDLLLDQNWQGEGATDAHTDDVPRACRRLLGPYYALLQPEYAGLRPLLPERTPQTLRRVLVFFGGSDLTDETGKALEALAAADFCGLAVDVVLGANHPAPAAIAAQVAALPAARLHPPQRSLAGLLARSDLFIGAGGATSWERLCLKLPSLVTTLADNQVPGTDRLARAGLVRLVGRAVNTTAADYVRALRAGCVLEAGQAPLVDGLGARRVAELLMPSSIDALRLRRADPGDAATLYAWRNDAVTRAMSFSSDPIDWSQHLAWLEQRLADVRTRLWIAELDGLPVGQIRLQAASGPTTLSYALDALVRGRGWSRWLVDSALSQVPKGERVVAHVKAENAPSLNVFRSLGWREESAPDCHFTFQFEGAAP